MKLSFFTVPFVFAIILVMMTCGPIVSSVSAQRPRPQAGGVLRQQVESAEASRRQILGEEGKRKAEQTDERDDAEAATSSADDTPLGVDVKSLHLIADQDAVSMDADPGRVPVVIAEALPAPSTLSAALEVYIGRPLSMKLLAEIQRDVVMAWRESDYPLVDVYFPEQNITGGKLQIVVKEAVLGEKKVEGEGISKVPYLLEQMRIERGDRISRRRVESDLDWLNENPVRQVDLIYQRGTVDGTSDIVLNVTEEKAFTAYTGFANTGIEETGEEEWSFGFNWANPFDQEQMIGYHFATDLEWDNLQAHSLFYQAFLPWRHTLRVIGAYVTSNSDAVSLLNVEGLSQQLTAEYRIPLMRPRFNRRWRHYLTFAFDYKSTNTDLLFGGVGFFGSTVSVGQFRGVYEAAVPDKWGYTRFSAGVVVSPGDIFDSNDDVNFAIARPGSFAAYSYSFAEVERLFRLPEDFSLRLKMTAQAAGDRLTSTEQMLAGGYSSVRGFDESLIRGDSGLVTTVEFISPDFSVCQKRGSSIDDTWNALVFYDAAALDITDALPGELSPSLQSAGLGLNCRFGDRGFARASYGWALDTYGVTQADPAEGKFHFGVTLTY
ncbi:MAG TPA: ShlB/FhaC/HecB family hemolysin secretion/activation protein [Verrucomicrobiales bacterium]|nr:ShlB/FhaC/HecB family hemolysin secretion/activation protein [Verrucomicrobiales bacterium]